MYLYMEGMGGCKREFVDVCALSSSHILISLFAFVCLEVSKLLMVKRVDRPLNVHWVEGTEEYSKTSRKTILLLLGISSGDVLPFFNNCHDPKGVHNMWGKKGGLQWFQVPTNGEPLRLK